VKIHSFKESLKKGQKAEAEFYALFKDKVSRSDGYIEDFKVLRTGKLLEVKTDSYDPSKTQNFFMERYSYDKQPGGPWQSQSKDIDYFIYWFPITMEFWCFKVDSLVAKLEELKDQCREVKVFNTGHVTTGLLVPRHLLQKININLEDIL
jgi:hypothetical protein